MRDDRGRPGPPTRRRYRTEPIYPGRGPLGGMAAIPIGDVERWNW
jgi:hypothetical protein